MTSGETKRHHLSKVAPSLFVHGSSPRARSGHMPGHLRSVNPGEYCGPEFTLSISSLILYPPHV